MTYAGPPGVVPITYDPQEADLVERLRKRRFAVEGPPVGLDPSGIDTERAEAANVIASLRESEAGWRAEYVEAVRESASLRERVRVLEEELLEAQSELCSVRDSVQY